MPKKIKRYPDTRFNANTIKDAERSWLSGPEVELRTQIRHIQEGREMWELDNNDQFFARYRRTFNHCTYFMSGRKNDAYVSFDVTVEGRSTTVGVELENEERVENTFEIFERDLLSAALPVVSRAEVKSKVFIGHGRDEQWILLSNHLRDLHGIEIEAYEIGSRTGHTIRDILASMLSKSAFAVLVMTGDDETTEGGIRARQNVIHEVGLFQGKLGFERVALVAERGLELPTNLDGIQRILFERGNIPEAYGYVVAVLRRESLQETQ